MSRVILLRQFESKDGVRYQGDYCDISQWRSHMFVKPTGLALNKKDTKFFFLRYCEHFADNLEVSDIPRNSMLFFMYCHAAYMCGCSFNKVQQVIIQFDNTCDSIDVFCLLKN